MWRDNRFFMYLYGIKNHDILPMQQHNYDKQHTLNDLIFEYEAISQKGTVVFYEETVFSQIIDYYESESAIDLALEAVDRGLSQHLYSTNLYCRKAELLAIQKQEDAALSAIQHAEVLSPSDYEVKLIKAEVLGLFGEYTIALSIIRELKVACHVDQRKQLANIFFSEGIIYECMQQYDSTYLAWKQALQFNPSHPEALDRIWGCIEMARKFDECIQLHTQIIDQDPYCEKAWYNLGHAHTYYGNYEDAIEAYEYAFIINKEFEWAYRHCADLCMEIKNYAKALDCYEDVLKYILPDGDLLFKVGQCYQFLGQLEFAQEFYKKSLRLDDINDEVYFHLGECAASLKKWGRAIRFYQKAIKIEDSREEYFAAIGNAYAQLNESEKATQYLELAIELAPEQTIYWIKYATFLMQNDAYEEVLDLLVEANEKSVGAELLYCKSACLFKMNESIAAIDVLAEALKEDFEMHPVLFNYLPELVTDRKINAVLDFYRYEV